MNMIHGHSSQTNQLILDTVVTDPIFEEGGSRIEPYPLLIGPYLDYSLPNLACGVGLAHMILVSWEFLMLQWTLAYCRKGV